MPKIEFLLSASNSYYLKAWCSIGTSADIIHGLKALFSLFCQFFPGLRLHDEWDVLGRLGLRALLHAGRYGHQVAPLGQSQHQGLHAELGTAGEHLEELGAEKPGKKRKKGRGGCPEWES